MAKTHTYLNFTNQTEEAFNFYKSVFGGEFVDKVYRFKDTSQQAGQPPLSEAEGNLIMHIELEILGGHHLMGTDAPESMGFKITMGNNYHISLEPNTREEAKSLFEALSAGGSVKMPLAEMFWGAYYGDFVDKFGVQWMINVPAKK